MELFRELTVSEIEHIAGGVLQVHIPFPPHGGGGGGGIGYGGGGGGGWGPGYETSYDPGNGGGDNYDPPPTDEPPPPDCYNTQPMVLLDGTSAPDGARYVVPEGVTNDFLNRAVAHIVSIRDNNIGNTVAVYAELYSMYTDRNNPYFVDFKDWGTERGPPGTMDGGNFTYYSEAAGRTLTGDVFEAFGNYFYGFITTVAGLSPEETNVVAGIMQAGGWVDDPQDAVHVNKGILAAANYLASDQQSNVFTTGHDCSG